MVKDLEDGEIEGADGGGEDEFVIPLEGPTPKRQRTNTASDVAASPSTKVEQKLTKKAHKQALKATTAASSLSRDKYFDVYGVDARASVEIKATSPIRLGDVQGLVLWILGEHVAPRWAFVKNKPLVRQVVMVQANGLTDSLFRQHREHLPGLRQLGDPVVVVGLKAIMQPAETTSALLNARVPRRKAKGASVPAATPSAGAPAATDGAVLGLAAISGGNTKRAKPLAPFPPSHYVMSLKDMQERNYPVPIVGPEGDMVCPEGYVSTRPAAPSGSPAPERLIGLDCEMCLVGPQQFALTRCTLVDQDGQVLLDELVVPDQPITDYNTRYSGITEEMLKGVTTTLADVQARVLDLVPAEALLVGHALDNDLKALRLLHGRLLDTVVMYPHPRGLPYRTALRALSEKFLKRRIQDGSHDSVVDARTALDLVQLKVRHGPAWGTNEDPGLTKLADLLGDYRRCVVLVDRKEVLTRFATGAASAIPVFSDVEAAEKAGSQATAAIRRATAASSSLAAAAAMGARGAEGSGCSAGEEDGDGEGGTQGPNGPGAGGDTQLSFIWTQLTDLSMFLHRRCMHKRRLSDIRRQEHAAASVAAAAAAATAGRVTAGRAAAAPGAASPATPALVNTPATTANGAAGGCVATQAGMCRLSPGGSAATAAAATTAMAAAAMVADEPGQGLAGGADDAGEFSAEQLLAAVIKLDQSVARIHGMLPSNSLLLVVTGQGDTSEVRRLQEQKYRRQNGLDGMPSWKPADEEALAALANSQMQGLCWAVIKP